MEPGELNAFSDVEIQQLMAALQRGGSPTTDENVEAVLRWATRIRVGATMLQGVLEGTFMLSVRDEQVFIGNNDTTP